MGKFRQGRRTSFSGGNRSRGSRFSARSNSFERKDHREQNFERGPFKKHEAICDQCGKSCVLPFKPRSGSPVYCKDCFVPNNNRSSSASPGISQAQFKELNTKLDKILAFLENVEFEDASEEDVEAESEDEPEDSNKSDK